VVVQWVCQDQMVSSGIVILIIKKIGKLNLLELFHGPTLAFKDIAMQVIGNMYEKILKKTFSY